MRVGQVACAIVTAAWNRHDVRVIGECEVPRGPASEPDDGSAWAARARGYPVAVDGASGADNDSAWRDAFDPHVTGVLNQVWP